MRIPAKMRAGNRRVLVLGRRGPAAQEPDLVARARGDPRAGHHPRHAQRRRPDNFTRGCNYTMPLTTQVNLPKMKAAASTCRS